MFADPNALVGIVIAVCAFGGYQIICHWRRGARRDAVISGALYALAIAALALTAYQIKLLPVGEWLAALFNGLVPKSIR